MTQGPYGQQPGYGPPPPGYGAPPQGYAPPPGAPQIAGMGDRLIARLIDGALLIAVALVLIVPGLVMLISSSDGDDDPSGSAVAVFLLSLVIVIPAAILYEPVLIAKRGATIGKKVMKLTVRLEATGTLPGAKAATFRFLIPLAASIAPFGSVLVYVSPLFDNSGRRQGWHDKVAKTVVVKG